LTWSYTPYSLAPLLAALSTGALAVYAWGRGRRTGRLFALFALAGCIWAFSYSLEILGGDLPTKLLWAKVGYAGSVTVPVTWLAFTLQYTGREKTLNARLVAAASIIPLTTLILTLTEGDHHLMWSSMWLETSGPFPALAVTHGPWFWIHTAYSYSLTFFGALLIFLATLRAPGLYRQQGWALLAGILLPWIGNVLFVSGWSRVPTLDLTSIAFTLSALIFGWAVFRFQLLDLLPVARDALVDASADGLIVLDARNRVVDLNLAARQILNEPVGNVLGRPATQLLAVGPELLALNSPPAQARAEWAIGANGQQRIYDLSVSPLADPKGRFTGRLIALRDITAHKATEAELRAQKQLFENLVAVARATAGGLSLEDTLQNVLNVAATLTGAERGSLFLLDAAEEVTHSLLTYRGVTPDERQDIVRRVMGRGLSGWVARHRQGALIADTAQDERWLASPGDSYPVASALGVPILSGAALVGVLTLSHSQPNRFKEEHLTLMQAAADQIALALRNAQIYDQQREMANHQAALYGVMRAVGETLEPQSVASAAVEAIVRLVTGSASWSAVSLALPNSERTYWTDYTRNGQSPLAAGERHRISEGIIGRAFATGQTQCVPRVGDDPDYFSGTPATRSELAVPLRRGERVLGVLNLESDRVDAFGPPDVQLAESLADAVALVLDNANLYQAIAGESSRLQALIKASRDGIFMVSVEQRLLVVNAPALSLLRLKGETEDWLGRPIAEVFLAMRSYAPQPVRTLLAVARQAQRGDEPPSEGEFEIAPRAIHWLSLPALSGNLPLGRLLVLRDVTEDRLVQKMREDLTHTMVHDLRNPLTNIRMALELLTQVNGRPGPANPDAQQREVVAIALNSTQRMLSLVNAILDVNRLESGQMPLVLEPLSLHDAANEVFRLQLPLVMQKNLRLENMVPLEMPPPYVDGGLVRRVLQNLVGNAIKFTPDDGNIHVSAAVEAGGSRVQVTVSDSGPGLPPEVRRNLFQKFVTGHHRERGSGLGLAYCRLAIEAHGGRIWAASEPGRGAVFHFTLPLGVNENRAE
jgi:PAS domain S-box-containing protein